jgi:NADH dehydrogenase
LTKPRVVILGAGIAGLRIAKKLEKKLRPDEAELLLIDQNDYHQLLYRLPKVFNYEYDQKDVIIPLKRVIDKIPFKRALVETIIPENNRVQTSQGRIEYDILVTALGSHPAYFNIEGIHENSMAFSGFEDARKVRAKIFQLYEKRLETNEKPVIVIGGAGFSGVELAGAISEFIEEICRKRGIEIPVIRLSLVEAMGSILPGWSEELAQKGILYLEKKGVKLYLNDPVVKVGERILELKSGRVLEPDLFIWTGGVEADPACDIYFEKRARRIVVNEYLQQEGVDNVFIVGDQACTVDFDDNPIPPSAHIAMGQADVVAYNILSKLRERDLKVYKYESVGEIVPIGEEYAFGMFYGITFSGQLAKLMKKLIHLWYIISIGGILVALEHW